MIRAHNPSQTSLNHNQKRKITQGIEQKGKRTHGHGQQCGDCWGVEDKGTKWKGKKIKIKLKIQNVSTVRYQSSLYCTKKLKKKKNKLAHLILLQVT